MVQAQRDSSHLEIGVNAVRIFTLFASPSPSYANQINPYMFTAEYAFRGFGLRLGYGMVKKTLNEDPSRNNATYYNTDSAMTNFRAGLVYCHNLTTRWSVKAGVDYLTMNYKFNKKTTLLDNNGDPDINQNDVTIKETGISPFLFLQYHLSKRVSLGTEMLAQFTSWKKTEETTSSGFQVFKTEKNSSGKNSLINPPSALFLIIRF
jgi:hypothetical protein